MKEQRKAGPLLFVLRDLGIGGAERVIVRLANYVAGKGIETHLLTLVADGPLMDEISEQVTVHSLHAKRIRSVFFRLVRRLRSIRPTVLVSTIPQVNALTVVASKALFPRPRVVIREANDPRHETPFSRRLRALYRLLLGVTYRGADVVIAVSRGVKEGLVETYKLAPNRIVALPNASIDDRIFALASSDVNDDWYESLSTRLVCVARLAPQKDHATLLEAMSLIGCEEKKIGLALIGDGPLEKDLGAKVKELGLEACVKFVQGESNPFRWLVSADLLVLASRWEGSPNVLVEALALGVPIVSTDCPSGPREILGGGEFGRLVPVGNPQKLAEAMLQTLAESQDSAALRERGMEFHINSVGPIWLETILGE